MVSSVAATGGHHPEPHPPRSRGPRLRRRRRNAARRSLAKRSPTTAARTTRSACDTTTGGSGDRWPLALGGGLISLGAVVLAQQACLRPLTPLTLSIVPIGAALGPLVGIAFGKRSRPTTTRRRSPARNPATSTSSERRPERASRAGTTRRTRCTPPRTQCGERIRAADAQSTGDRSIRRPTTRTSNPDSSTTQGGPDCDGLPWGCRDGEDAGVSVRCAQASDARHAGSLAAGASLEGTRS